MIKKIILILCLLALSFSNGFALTDEQKAAKEERNIYCKDNPKECIEKADFTIWVDDIYGEKEIDDGTEGDTNKLVNKLLWTIIQNLMIAMGSISLLIMTIWAWYMIFYNWQDDILSKWKSIFTWWLIALGVALTSYYMVAIIRFVLFKWN